MNTKVAHIICDRYLSLDGLEITIGGMQSYFSSLSEVLKEEGYSISIYHVADVSFRREYKGVTVCGFIYNGTKQKLPQALFNEVEKNVNNEQDLIIFGSEMWIVNSRGHKCIAIQHGIPWDVPVHCNFGDIKYWLYFIKKAYSAFRNIQKVNKVSHVVCVDYNYINWYRALVAYPRTTMHCIPNFSKIPREPKYKFDDKIRIIFARRLWQYRGTRIFQSAISRLLTEYQNLYVTIAGDGPDEDWLKEKLSKYGNVEFIHYSSDKSLEVHRDKQIAVVPTVGSEGTSLSLLEAMAAKCAVICTDVGGLTNVILDGYNGLIIPANNDEALYDSLKYLIENKKISEELAEKGYQTVCQSFSFEKWKAEWKKLLRNCL